MIHLSLNELKFAVFWAAHGRHLPPGLATDLAAACVALAKLEINPLPLAAGLLQGLDATIDWQKVNAAGPGAPFVARVPSVIDDLYAIRMDHWAVELEHPLLVMGYISASALPLSYTYFHQGECVLQNQFYEDGVRTLSVLPSWWEDPSHKIDVRSLASAVGVDMRKLKPIHLAAMEQAVYEKGLAVSEAEWSAFWDLTTAGFVENTEASRQAGAGAGLVDDD